MYVRDTFVTCSLLFRTRTHAPKCMRMHEGSARALSLTHTNTNSNASTRRTRGQVLDSSFSSLNPKPQILNPKQVLDSSFSSLDVVIAETACFLPPRPRLLFCTLPSKSLEVSLPFRFSLPRCSSLCVSVSLPLCLSVAVALSWQSVQS